MVPISNVAAITTPDARSIVIKPWDKSMFRVIEKAIIDSDLGIMPENNGENDPYRHPSPDGRTPVNNWQNSVKEKVKRLKLVYVTLVVTVSTH